MTLRRVVATGALLLAAACGDREQGVVAAGAHAGQECSTCHTGPASGAVVAPVSSARCTACHAAGAIQDRVVVSTVTLDHHHEGPDHVAATPCASCHTHTAGDAPLEVATTSCFLCHADPAPSGTTPGTASLPDTRCAECHVQPTHTAFAQTGAPIDHATVLARGVSCLLCHYDVVEGTGAVADATCRACHGRLEGPAALPAGRPRTDAGTLHDLHLADDVTLACARCHTPVNHAVVRLASALVLDCAGCHASGDPALDAPIDSAAHRAAQRLYAGLSPEHPDVQPSLKFTERVSCNACHSVESTRASGAAAVTAINAMCVDCHGPRFGTLLRPWLAGVDAHVTAVAAYVQTARAAGGADSLIAAAADALGLVAAGHGVHNLPGADSLLRSAIGAAERSYRHAGLNAPPRPHMGPAPARNTCARCHYGIDTDPTAPGRVPFEHASHIVAADLECSECHGTADFFLEDGRTFDPAHGSVLVGAADCAACHHVDTNRECAACHQAGEVEALDVHRAITVHVRRDDVRNTRDVAFRHTVHSGIACTACHVTPDPARPAMECADCHADHHEAVASPAGCALCHGTRTRDVHERVDHLSCGACHEAANLRLLGRADRGFCLQCHSDQVDHEPDRQCVQCHLQLTPDAAMRTIVSATEAPREPDRRPE